MERRRTKRKRAKYRQRLDGRDNNNSESKVTILKNFNIKY